jgi:hypothetical protein
MRPRHLVEWVVAGAFVAMGSAARAADLYTIGQRVEVREGDLWSGAVVTGHEGRQYHVHYDGSTAADDEWVTTERMRAVGSAPAAPAAVPKPTAAPTLAFSIGDAVEVKWGGLYRKARVVNARGGWYLIGYDGLPGDMGREWVESDRVRAIGSGDDPIGYAQPHPYRHGDGPPPGPSAVGSGDDQKTDPGGLQVAHGRHPLNAPEPDLTRPDSTVVPCGVTLTIPDLTADRTLEPTAVVAGRAPAVDAQPTISAPRMVSLNHGPPQAGTRASLLVTPQGHWAALSFRPVGSPTFVQRVETGTSDGGPVVQLAANVQPLAISPDGKRLVTRSDRGDRRAGPSAGRWRLDVWDIDRHEPRNLLSFRPYDPATDGSDAVEWADYVDASHLLTCSADHVVTLWQLRDTGVKAVYTLVGDGTLRPRLSGGGRYLVAGFADHLIVCDALSADCVARTADPGSPGDGLALRSDLHRLALSGGRRLVVVDLTGGTVTTDVGLPPAATGTEVGWVGPDLLLVDDRWLYDVARHRFAWEYQPAVRAAGESGGGQTVARTVGDRIWMLLLSGNAITGTEHRAVLSSAQVPDPPAKVADRKLTDGDLAVKPGAAVSLEVSLSGGSDADRREIIDRYTRQLVDDGYTVADGQPVKVVVRTGAGKSVTGQYHTVTGMFTNGDAPPVETVTATQTVYELSWQVAGQTVWLIDSVSGGVLPRFVFRRRDQSYADVVNAMNKPDLAWFLQQHVPREVLASTDAVGTSALTAAGARPRVAH